MEEHHKEPDDWITAPRIFLMGEFYEGTGNRKKDRVRRSWVVDVIGHLEKLGCRWFGGRK